MVVLGVVRGTQRRHDHAQVRDRAGRCRKDQEWFGSLRVEYQVSPKNTVFVAYSDRQNASNLAETFAYRNHVMSFGLATTFD